MKICKLEDIPKLGARRYVGGDGETIAVFRTATDGVFDNHGKLLVCGIIDNGEALECPTTCHPIEDEVHRPYLVGSGGTHERLALGYWDFLALASAQLQSLQCIKPIYPLVIHALASLAQLQVNHASAVATMTLGECDDLRTQRHVAIGRGTIAQAAGTHPHKAKCTPLG